MRIFYVLFFVKADLIYIITNNQLIRPLVAKNGWMDAHIFPALVVKVIWDGVTGMPTFYCDSIIFMLLNLNMVCPP